MKGSCLVLQSGGPTAVINASLCGVVQEAQRHSDAITGVLGACRGTIGLLQEDLIDLSAEKAQTIDALRFTPAMALGTCRYKVTDKDYQRILEVLEAHNVRFVFVIGGNDSMDTADNINKLAAGRYDLSVIGIPKTVDNDLPETDHTPGYGSAAKYMAIATMEAGRDNEAIGMNETVTIVECMGRDTGWLTAATAVARRCEDDAPHLVYVPEIPFDTDKFVNDVGAVISKLGRCVVAVSEGIRDRQGRYLAAKSGDLSTCDFGHVVLGGVGPVLCDIVEREVKAWCRYNLAGTFQRVGAHVASMTDINEAYMCGCDAVRAALDGVTGKMVTLVRESAGGKYNCSTGLVDLSAVANSVKHLPLSYVNDAGNHITDEMRDYVLPLIAGDPPLNRGSDGLPVYVRLDAKHVPKKTAQYKISR